MSGGAYERTASLIDNGNRNISTYGNNEHILNNKVKDQYKKYYDIYEPGDEEKEGSLFYGLEGQKLWNSQAPYNVSEESNNIIRKRLTDATYEKMASKKGDALWETSNRTSYYGRFTSGSNINYIWLIDILRDSSQVGQYATGWNGDNILVGHGYNSWFQRGGIADFGSGSKSGITNSNNTSGYAYPGNGFRPVLVVENNL
ncbi:hypothetical protein D3C73_1015610 [compost metagenome]